MTPLWLLPLVPAVGGGVLLLAGRRADRAAAPLAVLLAATALGLAGLAWTERPASALPWLEGLDLSLSAAGAAGPLSVLAAAMSLLVFVYAWGFLDAAEPRGRFFGFMSLFLGAMLWLTLAGDLLTLLIGWELVGLCSYALIGFWYRERERTRAALRAFAVTRTADLSLYLAAMAALTGGSAAFASLHALPEPLIGLAAAGVLIAAIGKSAQLPFTGWLSGAMEGPTPVSALLHSATMVAAGVVLLVKAQPLFEAVGWAGPLAVWIGTATALTAAVIALFQAETKQLLAASTASQYGYMFAALGAGGVAGATAHLANHAAFKGLLFLAAGVLVAQHLKYFREMGGLRRLLPGVAALFGVAALSLAALPPLGGFFSKEALLHAVSAHHPVAHALLLAGAFLTAAYAARVWLAAYAGRPREDFPRVSLSPPGWLMRLPMLVLAAAVILLGALALRGFWAAGWAEAVGAAPPAPLEPVASTLAALLAAAGAGWALYLQRRDALVPMRLPMLPTLSRRAEVWLGLEALLDRSGLAVLALARALERAERAQPARAALALVTHRSRHALAGADEGLVARETARLAALVERIGPARLMDGTVRVGRLLADLGEAGDRRLLDGGLARLGGALSGASEGLGRVQGGLLHRYYLVLALGVAVLFLGALAVTWG
jgi:NADH:ubiquinone oxidoreductase subunit 5 (subunit L)/multisubunit Na+/H+ antiporter MnhA subunit